MPYQRVGQAKFRTAGLTSSWTTLETGGEQRARSATGLWPDVPIARMLVASTVTLVSFPARPFRRCMESLFVIRGTCNEFIVTSRFRYEGRHDEIGESVLVAFGLARAGSGISV